MTARRDFAAKARQRSAVVPLVVLLVSLSILGSSPTVRAAAPTLTVLAPADRAVIGNGTPVFVSFLVTDFDLVQPGRVGQNVSPNEGHVDVFVDSAYTQVVYRVEPILLPLDSGPHTITLQLKANDGTPLIPDVSASVAVTVTHGPATGAPGMRILAPSPGLATGHDVYVAVQVSNFTLVDPHGQPNAPNEGHLVVRVEGVYYTELATYAPAFLVDLGDGTNTITVSLVNNDGTPLSPEVSASTYVYIKPSTTVYVTEIVNASAVVLLVIVLTILVRRRRTGPKAP